jgi:hypothetical protein
LKVKKITKNTLSKLNPMKMIKVRLRLCLTSLVIMLLFTAGTQAQEKLSLEYKYKKGNTYRYKAETAFETTQEMMGQEMKYSGNSYAISKMIVDDVAANGDISVTTSLEDMKTSVKASAQAESLDTSIQMKELIGKKSGIIISKYGAVVKTITIDSIKLAGASMGLGDMGSGATNSAERLFRLPDHEVKTGDKWTSEKNDSTSMEALKMLSKTQTEYKLAGREKRNTHDCLKITYTAKIEISGKMNQMGMEMFMEGNGDNKGTIWFDPKTGILISEESASTQDMTLAMTGQMSMTIPTTTTTKTIFNLIE